MDNIKLISPKPGVNLCAVKVPEDAHTFDIKQSKFLYEGEYVLTYRCPVIWDTYKKESWEWATHTPNRLQILGMSTELTEEQCKKLLGATEYIDDLGYFLPCYGYWGFKHYKSAISAFASFLQSEVITEPVLILASLD